MTPDRGELLAEAHVSPFEGQAISGFVVAGLAVLFVAVAGVAGGSGVLLAWGIGSGVVVGLAFILFVRTAPSRPAVRVYRGGIGFLRGHRRGWLPFEAVSNASLLEWGGSIYPYSRRARYLVLETSDGEWEIGPEVAGSEAILDLVAELVRRR